MMSVEGRGGEEGEKRRRDKEEAGEGTKSGNFNLMGHSPFTIMQSTANSQELTSVVIVIGLLK